MKFPKRETVDWLRMQYPVGTRIELIAMNDPYSKLMPGEQGTVSIIDDTGTVFLDWDSGSRLGLVYGVDSYKAVKNNAVTDADVQNAARYCGRCEFRLGCSIGAEDLAESVKNRAAYSITIDFGSIGPSGQERWPNPALRPVTVGNFLCRREADMIRVAYAKAISVDVTELSEMPAAQPPDGDSSKEPWIWDRLQEERDAGNPEHYDHLFEKIEDAYAGNLKKGISDDEAKHQAFKAFEEQINAAVREENADLC